VRSGELQGFAQYEGKAEAMHEAEHEGGDPASARARADEVLQGHGDDRDGDQPLHQRREPESLRGEAQDRGGERQRVRHREGGGDYHQRPEAAKRDDQAGDEQQVVGAVEDVQEAALDEAQRCLVPARVEAHQARIAVELERTLGAAGRQVAQRRHHPQAHARQPRLDREPRPVGRNRQVEQQIEVLRLPVQLGLWWNRRRPQVRHGLVPRGERAVGGQRHARHHERRPRQAPVVLEQAQVVGEPQLGGDAQRRVGAGEVEVTGAAQRHVDLVHRPERHAQQHVQVLALGLDEGLDADVGGNVVGEGRRRGDRREQRQHEREAAPDRFPDPPAAVRH
jgi:hypothetical protein